MPTYQYACTQCDERLEAVQSFTDEPLTECPVCGGRLRKVFSAVGVVFKGSGFYKNDSRSGGSGGGDKAGADKGSGDKGSGDKSSDKGSDAAAKTSDKGAGAGSDKSSGSGAATPAAAGSGSGSSGSSSGSAPAAKAG